MSIEIIKMAVAIVLLVVGSDLLVRGASSLAKSFGISSLVIGLTVVALGTSTPELVVSANAALSGKPDIAIGNVVGSNIFNILFILGLSSIIIPLFVSKQLIKLDVPIMIFAVSILYLFSLNQLIGQFEGFILIFLGIFYTIFLIKKSKSEISLQNKNESKTDNGEIKIYSKTKSIIFFVIGLALLVFGGNTFVDSSVEIARLLGISELIIGLTIVSIGTSLPEVATSIMASFKGERDIAVGNVVGSNILNVFLILGVAATLSPNSIPINSSMIYFDLPILVVVSFICFPLFFTGQEISRWEGAILLLYYVTYTVYLIMQSTHYLGLNQFNSIIFYFIVPLTLIIIISSFINSIRKSRKKSKNL